MLRLEKLEISGFKSFADRTTLVFGEGITGVVGPNGCGKSNISDAISWVLGEQSPKSLRGAKMEDVIFNGTRDRKPLPMAEVLLTMMAIADITARESESDQDSESGKFDVALENADRAARTVRSLVEEFEAPKTEDAADQPITAPFAEQNAAAGQAVAEGQQPTAESPPQEISEHKAELHQSRQPKRKKVVVSAGERVTVGRRLYRTGDSDYIMNGRACLLRDIQDLFAGTGLGGGAHYAIIEQGRIGQILSSKPLDRRGLIEEAAGITKFKAKKRLAELKLESARQNLTRLNDIISEVERQVNSLKRQAAKARRFGRLREEMRSLLKLVFAADYYRLNETAERIRIEMELARTAQEQSSSLVASHETEHRAVAAHARAAEDNLAALKERASAIELEADRVRNRRKFEEQQLKELATRIEDHSRSQSSLLERLSVLDSEMEQRSAGLGALQTEVTEEQSRLIEKEAAYQLETSKLRDAEGNIERLRQQLVIEIGKTERLQNGIGNLEEAMRRLDLKQNNLAAEHERAQAKRDEAGQARAQMETQIEMHRNKLAELGSDLEQRAGALQSLRVEVTELRSRLDEIQAERSAAERLLQSLRDVNEHHSYYSDAVRQVLSPEHARRVNAMGTLADFVEVDQSYERLVESLFGGELQSVLVPTIDDALAGVEYLKTEKLGRGGFLVVGLHGAEDDPSDYFLTTSGGDDREDIEQPELEAFPVTPTGGAREFSDRNPFAESNREPEPGRDPVRFQLEVLRAIDLIGMRPEIRAVVERAFPDKCAACVVPDVEAALELSMENGWRTYVTYEGEQVVNGRLIVTSAQAGNRGASLLGIKREIKDLEERWAALRSQEEMLVGTLNQHKASLTEMEDAVAVLDSEIRKQEKSAAARASEIQSLTRDFERAEQHVRVVEAETEQAAEERVELQSKQSQLALEVEGALGARNIAQESLESAQSVLAEMRAAVERFSEELSATRAAAAARAERLKAAQSEIRRLQNEAADLNSRINRVRLELYESQSRTEHLNTSYEEGGGVALALETEAAGLAGEIAVAGEGLVSVRTRSDELGAMLIELRQELAAAGERKGQLEVEQARTESEAEHLAKSCFSELAASLAEVVAGIESMGSVTGGPAPAQGLDDLDNDGAPVGNEPGEEKEDLSPADDNAIARGTASFDVDQARSRLDELRIKVEEIGSVNMMALEELEESEERFGFLSTQRRDILDSIKGTEEALAEIKKRSRERFRHAFTNINENFQLMFVELFGGGRGEMVLIDEEDVLESGIDIIAQPPGKRLQNVLLLSGGEKAMAAIALILAVFQYRPSPFCVLDEVDAPLDEMNVGRFAGKILEMSTETQFLAITHNKRTMESARALYGVTMEEPGVSKLVSVKFE
jgi:chromosome segregation protein